MVWKNRKARWSMKIKKYISFVFKEWEKDDLECVRHLLEKKPGCALLDLGCGDMTKTQLFVKSCGATKVVGVDGIKQKPKKGIKQIVANINERFPFQNQEFDVVISHFSLEHLYNPGLFLSEVKRVLKKGGYFVVATDNMASWPNVLSLLCGYQPLSTTDGVWPGVSVGNPLAKRSLDIKNKLKAIKTPKALENLKFEHNKVMSYQMLHDALKIFDFDVEVLTGVGYFPFYGWLSKLMSKIDARHSHFIVAKARRS